MSKVFRIIFNRLTITIFLLLLQISFITFILNEAADYYAMVNFILIGVSILFAVLLFLKKGIPPTTKIPILIFLIAFPIAGIFLYYFSIQNRMRKKFIENVKQQTFTLESLFVENNDITQELQSQDLNMYLQSQFISNNTFLPVYANNFTKFYPVGETFFEDLIKDLKSAKHFIFLEFFIIAKRSFVE